MTLFGIYSDYKNGNTDSFNAIVSDKVIHSGGKYSESHFKIKIKDLENLACTLFNKYHTWEIRPKSIDYPKYSPNVYCGTKEDMKKDVVLLLYQIFNDGDFSAETEADIYRELKYRAVKFINDGIKVSQAALPLLFSDKGDPITYNSENKKIHINIQQDKDEIEDNIFKSDGQHTRNYNGGFRELLEILQNYDIRDFCQADAKVQRNIIDLIYKKYIPFYNDITDTTQFPSEEKMIEYYFEEYGETISQSQYSRALNSIFETLCDCTTAFKGLQNRRAFINGGGK